MNGTQAAIRAGYSKATAKEIAAQNLSKLNIQEKISELMAARSKRTEITADMVLCDLAAIAFADRTEIAKITAKGAVKFTPTDELPQEVKKIILGIKEGKHGIEVTTADKIKALELLGKHLGLFDKHADNADALAKLDEVLVRIVDDI